MFRWDELQLARAYYFVCIGAMGMSFPFANLFFRERGLSGAEIGLVLTCGAVAGLLAAPLWGRRSDSGASLTRLLQGAFLLTALGLLAQSQQWFFVGFALTNAWRGVTGAGIGPLSDTLTLRLTAARRAGYGSVRVWGSAGWAASVLFSGWMIERASLTFGFYAHAVGYVLAALLLFWMPKALRAGVVTRAETRGGLRRAVRAIGANRALAGLALALFVRGILAEGHYQFGNIYLEELGAGTAVIGAASMMAAAVELPGFFLADRAVKKIGAARALQVSFLISGAKFILVLTFPAVWSVTATFAIEGIAFSLFLTGLMRYIVEHAPASQLATLLALFTVTWMALIQIIGAPIGGIVFDAVGAYWLYALALVGNFLAAAILLLVARVTQNS